MWFVFALLSAVFAALTSILAKVGIEGVNSNLATAIRTCVVVVMSWGMVFLTNAQKGLGQISNKSWLFLILSGLATGAARPPRWCLWTNSAWSLPLCWPLRSSTSSSHGSRPWAVSSSGRERCSWCCERHWTQRRKYARIKTEFFIRRHQHGTACAGSTSSPAGDVLF